VIKNLKELADQTPPTDMQAIHPYRLQSPKLLSDKLF